MSNKLTNREVRKLIQFTHNEISERKYLTKIGEGDHSDVVKELEIIINKLDKMKSETMSR